MQPHTQSAIATPPQPFHFKFTRKPDVFKQFGFGNTHLHNLINDGRFPPSMSIGGERSVAFLQHELDQLAAFMVAGKSKDEIRTLVAHMVEQRKNAV